jgi:hypothetical protein
MFSIGPVAILHLIETVPYCDKSCLRPAGEHFLQPE